MKLKQMEFLVALKRSNSFSRVADEMYVSQPAISVAIKELESELDCTLMRRTNRGIEFNEFGLAVAEQAEVIVQAADRIRRMAEEHGGGRGFAGSIRIGSLPHICNTFIVRAQQNILNAHPALKCNLSWSDSKRLMAQVEDGSLNLAIIHSCEVGREELEQKIRSGKVRYGSLYTERFRFVVYDHHPLLQRARLTLEDLKPYPYMCFKNDDNCFVREFREQYGYPNKLVHCDDMTGLRLQMVSATAVTMQPQMAISHGNANYRVQLVPIEVENTPMYSSVGWLHGPDRLSPAERALIQELTTLCAGYTPNPAPEPVD